MKERLLAVSALLVSTSACGPSAPAEHPTTVLSASNAPPAASSSAAANAPPADPWAVDGLVREEWLPLLSGPAPTYAAVTLPATPKNVPPPPPAACNAYVNRPTTSKAACKDKTAALSLVDEAMAALDATARDTKLAALESCAAFDPGVDVLDYELMAEKAA